MHDFSTGGNKFVDKQLVGKVKRAYFSVSQIAGENQQREKYLPEAYSCLLPGWRSIWLAPCSLTRKLRFILLLVT